MRHYASVLTLVVGMATFADAPTNWPISRAEKSLLKLELIDPTRRNEETGEPARGSCTIVAIKPTYFITSSHCIVPIMHIGNIKFDVVETDTVNDIAIIKGDMERPPMALGKEPKRGDEVLLIGYTAPNEVFFFPALIMGNFDPWMKGDKTVVTSANAIMGMSGGAIINRNGDMVGMITGGGNPSSPYQNVGIGVTYKALKRTIQRVMLISASEK